MAITEVTEMATIEVVTLVIANWRQHVCQQQYLIHPLNHEMAVWIWNKKKITRLMIEKEDEWKPKI